MQVKVLKLCFSVKKIVLVSQVSATWKDRKMCSGVYIYSAQLAEFGKGKKISQGIDAKKEIKGKRGKKRGGKIGEKGEKREAVGKRGKQR